MTPKQEKLLIEKIIRPTIRKVLMERINENSEMSDLQNKLKSIIKSIQSGKIVDSSAASQNSAGALFGMLVAQSIYSALSDFNDPALVSDARKYLNWKL